MVGGWLGGRMVEHIDGWMDGWMDGRRSNIRILLGYFTC